MSLTTSATQAVHDRRQDDPGLLLITITHSDFAATIRLVGNNEDITSNSNVFTGGMVDISLPDEGDDAGRGNLSIDDIDASIRSQIIAASSDERIAVKAELVLASTPDTVIKTWPDLEWRGVNIETDKITGALVQETYDRELWPPRVMNGVDFPGARW